MISKSEINVHKTAVKTTSLAISTVKVLTITMVMMILISTTTTTSRRSMSTVSAFISRYNHVRTSSLAYQLRRKVTISVNNENLVESKAQWQQKKQQFSTTNTLLYSSTIPINHEQQQQEQQQHNNNNFVPTSINKKRQRYTDPIVLNLNTALLKRTQQSRAFREGNQLVFTRAIQSILSNDNKNRNFKVPQGELVFVSVAGKSSSSTTSSSSGTSRSSSGGYAGSFGKNDNRKRTDNDKQTDSSTSTTTTSSNTVIGIGTYNNESLYKVRILVHKYINMDLFETIQRTCTTSIEAIHAILTHHIQAAIRLRTAMGLVSTTTSSTNMLPIIDTNTETETDTYRLVNGEGDSLSGLVIDIIGGSTIVVMSSASWCEIYKDIIINVITNELHTSNIIWKSTPSRLRQDGYLNIVDPTGSVDNNNDFDDDDEDITSIIHTNNDNNNNDDDNTLNNRQQMIVSKENGLYFETYPYDIGQKTGVYSDQRENRAFIAKLCTNKNILDLCCYHGGFGITAAVHGHAKSITFVDSSATAIHIAKANAIRNNVLVDNNNSNDNDKCTFINSDIGLFLQNKYRQISESDDDDDTNTNTNNMYYDVIILDPPKLAPSVKVLDKAQRKYHAFNRDAIKLINPAQGGLLLSCTCSAAMTCADNGQLFINTIHGAALAAGRYITLVKTTGAASCHTISPICQPAGAYLTAALFYVHPIRSSTSSTPTTNIATTSSTPN